MGSSLDRGGIVGTIFGSCVMASDLVLRGIAIVSGQAIISGMCDPLRVLTMIVDRGIRMGFRQHALCAFIRHLCSAPGALIIRAPFVHFLSSAMKSMYLHCELLSR